MKRRRRGVLVALEGIDGVGKSTLARSMAGALRRRGITVGLWREPVDRELGALAQRAGATDPWTGAMYFTLDRYLARPKLASLLRRNRFVITDRSFYSTLAYQGCALARKARVRLEELSRSASIPPDRVILLHLPPPDALARLGRRARLRGPLERRQIMERVGRRYLAMARERDWQVLDARQPVGDLVQRALDGLGASAVGRRGPR